jgi:hypothetical protein
VFPADTVDHNRQIVVIPSTLARYKLLLREKEGILFEDLAVSVSRNPAESFEGAVLRGFVVAASPRWVEKRWPLW